MTIDYQGLDLAPKACAPLRQQVSETAAYIASLDFCSTKSEVDSADQSKISKAKLNSAYIALSNKPPDCEMNNNGQPNVLVCEVCNFEECLFPFK